MAEPLVSDMPVSVLEASPMGSFDMAQAYTALMQLMPALVHFLQLS